MIDRLFDGLFRLNLGMYKLQIAWKLNRNHATAGLIVQLQYIWSSFNDHIKENAGIWRHLIQMYVIRFICLNIDSSVYYWMSDVLNITEYSAYLWRSFISIFLCIQDLCCIGRYFVKDMDNSFHIHFKCTNYGKPIDSKDKIELFIEFMTCNIFQKYMQYIWQNMQYWCEYIQYICQYAQSCVFCIAGIHSI